MNAQHKSSFYKFCWGPGGGKSKFGLPNFKGMALPRSALDSCYIQTKTGRIVQISVRFGIRSVSCIRDLKLPKPRFKRRTIDAFNWVEFNASTFIA